MNVNIIFFKGKSYEKTKYENRTIVSESIARSEIQMGTGNEFINFNLIKK